jgi:hypothetical protein
MSFRLKLCDNRFTKSEQHIFTKLHRYKKWRDITLAKFIQAKFTLAKIPYYADGDSQ